MSEDPNQAYDPGLKGIWKPANFSAYGTPGVPAHKALLPGQTKQENSLSQAQVQQTRDTSRTRGPTWRRHTHQLLRHRIQEDTHTGDKPRVTQQDEPSSDEEIYAKPESQDPIQPEPPKQKEIPEKQLEMNMDLTIRGDQNGALGTKHFPP